MNQLQANIPPPAEPTPDNREQQPHYGLAIRILVNLCRFVVASVLVFSGFVKLIDPWGTYYKIEEVMRGISGLSAAGKFPILGLSVGLSAIELTLGICLLFAIHRRVASRLTAVLLGFFTLLTLWIYTNGSVSDCGCFGDAVVLTNGETFFKNLLLFPAALLVSLRPLCMVRFVSRTNQWIVVNFTVLFSIGLASWSLYDLPPLDFRPYHIGADLRSGLRQAAEARQPQFETTFIMEKNGKRREFTLDNYPDSTWTFIDSKSVMTDPGEKVELQDFSIVRRSDGEDITQAIVNDKGYTFLLVAPVLEEADDGSFGDIDRLYEYCLEQNYPFYCLTASSDHAVREWQETTGAEYPFCTTDGTTLKTIIRSNPGLLLLKDGKVVRKWSRNFLPQAEEMGDRRLEQLAAGQPPETSFSQRMTAIILWFILPLIALTIADRLWAWTTWLKKKEEDNRIYQLIKKKNE